MNAAATEEVVNRAPVDPALDLFCVIDEEGRVVPGASPLTDSELLLRMYREMKRVRLLDQRMVMLQRQGRVGFYGACTGQEAAVVGTALAAAPGDWIFPALRENAIMLVRGFPVASYIAQVFGNSRDPLKGRQMPAHISSRSVNQVSWSSCVGTQLPQAVGAGWAARLRGDPTVSIGFLGDGATSEADFHTALNFAAVFQAQTVLVCQNNQWAISVPVSRQTAAPTLAVKARAYGMHAVRADGNDIVAVYQVLSEALERARHGHGPTFVELLTYRVAPHSTSDDPSRYRSNDDVEAWIKKDPLDRMVRHLTAKKLLTAEADERLEQAMLEEIRKAIEEVESYGPPERASLFDDVYAELPEHLAEQRELLEKTPRGHHKKPSESGT
jgi:pyruvate dehydrogenase E1 component alpha subunit/2-oxoisovalerate dehydrogenase E1 component alpha subunit